jgi:hypothetical protein
MSLTTQKPVKYNIAERKKLSKCNYVLLAGHIFVSTRVVKFTSLAYDDRPGAYD